MQKRRKILPAGCGAIGGIFAAKLDSAAGVAAFDTGRGRLRATIHKLERSHHDSTVLAAA